MSFDNRTQVFVYRLKRHYADALAQIDSHLQHWPKFLVHKNKQRLTKITQFLIRMRKLTTKARTKLIPLATRYNSISAYDKQAI